MPKKHLSSQIKLIKADAGNNLLSPKQHKKRICASRNLVHPKTGISLSKEELEQGIKGISYSSFYNQKLVDPKSGKALSLKEIEAGKEGIKYSKFISKRLVDPHSGSILSDREKKQGKIGVSYTHFRNNQLVHPDTGLPLSPQEITKGSPSIRFSCFRSRILVHPVTGIPLSKEDLAEGKEGIHHHQFIQRRLVNPKTGKALTAEQINQGKESISYSLFYIQRLVDPFSGKALSEEDLAKGKEGIRYSAFCAKKRVHPSTGQRLSLEEIAEGKESLSYSAFSQRRKRKRLAENTLHFDPLIAITLSPESSKLSLNKMEEKIEATLPDFKMERIESPFLKTEDFFLKKEEDEELSVLNPSFKIEEVNRYHPHDDAFNYEPTLFKKIKLESFDTSIKDALHIQDISELELFVQDKTGLPDVLEPVLKIKYRTSTQDDRVVLPQALRNSLIF